MSIASWETRGKRGLRGKGKENAEIGVDDEVDSASEDAVAKTRSSARHVSRVIAKFDDKKKKLVNDIGFGGILHVPQLNKVNRKFSLWLLSRIDVEKGTLLLKEDIELPITPENISKVLGIPNGSKPVHPLSEEDEKDFVEMCLGVENGSADGLKEASEIVEKEYPNGMGRGEEMIFQSSFVMFVMGHFLAPTTQHDVGMTDFLGAVCDVEEMAEYNWAGYVGSHLIAAARKAQAERKAGKQLTYVTGCPLLLQILYLDCMDFGPMNQKHDVFPRMKAFWDTDAPCKLMSQMIQADTVSGSTAGGDQTFGCTKVRQLDTLCYEVSVRPMFAARNNTISQPVPVPQEMGAAQVEQPDFMKSSWQNGVPDLGKFLKEKYGDQLSSPAVDALKFHNARCLQHLKNMKVNILRENIVLADKLLSLHLRVGTSKQGGEHVRPNREELLSGPESGGEDNNVSIRKRKAGNNVPKGGLKKQYCNTTPRTYRTNRGYWGRPPISSPNQNFAETILSGGYMPLEDCNKHTSNADQQQRTPTNERKDNEQQEHTPQAVRTTPGDNGDKADQTNRGYDPMPQIPEEDGSPETTVSDKGSEQPSEIPAFCAQPNNLTASTNNSSDDIPTFDLGIDMTETNQAHNGNVVSQEGSSSEVVIDTTVLPMDSPADSSFHTPVQSKPKMEVEKKYSPTSWNRNFCNAALFDKMVMDEDYINLNKTPTSEEYANSLVKKKAMKGRLRFARSHWDAKLCMPEVDSELSKSLFEWLSTTSSPELSRPWIMHQTATYLELTGTMIKEQFCHCSNMSFDMFDASIRLMRQLDSQLYLHETDIRWRHWLESDFAMHVLAGEDPTTNVSIKDQFLGKSADYNLQTCRMIIVPFQSSEENWCAYIWDMKKQKIHILDPNFNGQNATETLRKHENSVKELQKGLSSCFSAFFDGWEVDWSYFVTNLPGPGWSNMQKGDTGLCTLFLVRYFNGLTYTKTPTKESLTSFKMSFLYEMMALRNNKGRLPSVYVQAIDD